MAENEWREAVRGVDRRIDIMDARITATDGRLTAHERSHASDVHDFRVNIIEANRRIADLADDIKAVVSLRERLASTETTISNFRWFLVFMVALTGALTAFGPALRAYLAGL